MNIKDEILNQLELNKGNYISGGKLAKNLSVSRNAIWKAVKKLENEGYLIDAVSNRGYCLLNDNDILSKQSISKYLNNNLDIMIKESVSSTNTVLKEMAEQGAAHGTVLIATEQTMGKGRMGKHFYSPKDAGIYLSILVRPDMPADQALFLTTSAAVAVSKAIESVSDKKAEIKWVNDIYIDGKKVCGILTEAALNVETNRLDYAIVGIGINICPPKGSIPKDLHDIIGFVFDSKSDSKNKKKLLIANLLNYFMEYYRDFDKKSYVQEYIDRSMIIGKDIRIIEGDQITDAHAIKIDNDCRLIVCLEKGDKRVIQSGEVSIKIQQ